MQPLKLTVKVFEKVDADVYRLIGDDDLFSYDAVCEVIDQIHTTPPQIAMVMDRHRVIMDDGHTTMVGIATDVKGDIYLILSGCAGGNFAHGVTANFKTFYGLGRKSNMPDMQEDKKEHRQEGSPPGQDKKYDVNRDGKITLLDATFILARLREFAGDDGIIDINDVEEMRINQAEEFKKLIDAMKRCDVDGDNKVTMADVEAVLHKLYGLAAEADGAGDDQGLMDTTINPERKPD